MWLHRHTPQAVPEEPAGVASAASPKENSLYSNFKVAGQIAWFKHLAAALLFLALTLLLTWPLPIRLTEAVPGAQNLDADQNIWNLWWFKTALLDRHTNPFYTDLLYYPYWQKGLPLIFHNLQPLNGLLALPVTALGGPLMAFNFIAVLAFTLTGFNAYLLGWHFVKNWWAALLVGALYSYAPLHLGYFHFSNMETMTLQWMPLYILGLHLWTGDPGQPLPRQRYGYLFLAAAALVANAMSDWYFTLYMLLYTALWMGWQFIRQRQKWRTLVGRFVLLGLASAVLASPIIWLVWQALKSSKEFVLVRGIQEEITWSAAPWSFFISTRPFELDPPHWGVYFFGYVALLLALCALPRRKHSRWWWLVIGLFLVLGMGPYLRFTDSSRVTETTGIPLPYLLLRELPLVSVSRIVGRFYFVADLGVALLAGYGFLNVLGWLSRLKFTTKLPAKYWRAALVVVLLCAWVLEVQVLPIYMYQPQPNPFYTNYLQASSDHRALLELPIPKTNEFTHTRMLNQVYHSRPIVGGYLSRPLKDYYRTSVSPFHLVLSPSELTAPPLNSRDFVSPDQQLSLLEMLAYYNFGYVILYNQEYSPPQLAATVQNYQLTLGAPVYQDAELTAFKVPSAPPLKAPKLYTGENWYAAETTQAGDTFRWAKNGDGYLGLIAPTAANGLLSFKGWNFDGEAEISVLVNGAEKARFRFTPVPTTYQLNLSWQPDINTIEFKTSLSGKSPGNGDNRNLTFALENLVLS